MNDILQKSSTSVHSLLYASLKITVTPDAPDLLRLF